MSIEASTGSVLSARELTRHYEISRGLFKPQATVRALNGVSFELAAGETLAVVGESGCGKSTLARALTLIEEPTFGSLQIAGQEVAGADKAQRKQLRRDVQMVFQNPYASLNPRQKIGDQLAEPLVINTGLSRSERRERVQAMMQQVGLRPEHYQRYPHMFSGGQRQRIALARAMMLNPKVLIADGARCVDSGAGAEPVHGPAGAVQRRLRVHFSRPGGGSSRGGQGAGHVFRQPDGNGSGGADLYPPLASIYPGAAGGDPKHSARCGATEDQGQRRTAQPARSAWRLPLPHALSARHRALSRRSTGIPTAGRKAGGLPLRRGGR